MNLSEKDYLRLYRLQDKFLAWWSGLDYPFYLTGGTALGRFYLNHRYSEDLDFFVNNHPQYLQFIADLKNKIQEHFRVNINQSLFTDDFTRFFILEDDISLKIEMVNDIGYYAGKPAAYQYGYIDTPLNILSNKLVAITGRDEPKDMFDILIISENYSFNWKDIFYHSKQKAVINEIDVEEHMVTFPVKWLMEVNWLKTIPEIALISKKIRQIADDFLLGADNSLGSDKIPIENAKPL